mgnify:CR=1 FL=1
MLIKKHRQLKIFLFIIIMLFINNIVYAKYSSSNSNIINKNHGVYKSRKNKHNILDDGNNVNNKLHINENQLYSKLYNKKNDAQNDNSNLNILESNFDFSYFGDIDELPEALKKIDDTLVIKKSIGQQFNNDINIDIQNGVIADIISAVKLQTNGKVDLFYNSKNNTILISYHKNLDTANDPITESLKWQQGGTPKPVLKADGVVRFPYGEYQPIITCQPLNLCDIELQAGEEIQGIIIGDSVNWNDGDQGIPIVYSGSSNKSIPHLVLKPSRAGLDTSLMITTSKRSYLIKLRSSMIAYVARSGFYYPSEMVQNFNKNNKNNTKNSDKNNNINSINSVDADNIDANTNINHNIRNDSGVNTSHDDTNANENTNDIATNLSTSLINLKKLNYSYHISGGDYFWKPIQVFDDGNSVFIQMPDNIGSKNLPTVCVMINNDPNKCELVNFRYNQNFYIIDKLFDKASLMNSFENRSQIIMIEHINNKGFWHRLFG